MNEYNPGLLPDEDGYRERLMCERPDAMTPERLAHIEKDVLTGGSAYDYFAELVEEIKLLWDDKLSMVPVEQA